MTYTMAKKWLRKAERCGYVAYHKGIVVDDKKNYGINIDGDGHNGRNFGCPEIIWSVEHAEQFFRGGD